ncbi:hypothetical protein VZT92_009092 [Zoarces viviparus]|uniref:Uncharacterized protein n=1 Tax=Zoarces viviparus TaxID=48416 RepID=A0AAW1FGD9_ZOAVI
MSTMEAENGHTFFFFFSPGGCRSGCGRGLLSHGCLITADVEVGVKFTSSSISYCTSASSLLVFFKHHLHDSGPFTRTSSDGGEVFIRVVSVVLWLFALSLLLGLKLLDYIISASEATSSTGRWELLVGVQELISLQKDWTISINLSHDETDR